MKTTERRVPTFTRQYACIVLDFESRAMRGYAGSAGDGMVVLSHRAARKFSPYPEAIIWALAHGRDFGPGRAVDVVGLVDAPD